MADPREMEQRPGPVGPPLGAPPENPYPGLGRGPNVTNDPAFQPPSDPARSVSELKSRVMLISREIPNVNIQSGWAVQDVRNSIEDLVVGLFDTPSQLHDTIAGDSRMQSAMRSRSSGLLGRAVRFKEPAKAKDPRAARKCRAAWENHWPIMAAEAALLDLLETAHDLGFSYSQLLWDTSRSIWRPYPLTFNSRYSYYHWDYRVHVAITRDGQEPVTGGDGHWILHAPYGSYRGWMRGSMRAVAQWWLARNYALRDFARYCEKHGFPFIIADTPFGADPNDVANYAMLLQSLGQETVIQVPGSVDVSKFGKYDVRFVEPKDQAWQGFLALIQQCNDEMTLALLGQNLTTEVKEGSLAAARVHADVRQSILEADARALARTIYTQIARPFAALNFGDPDLAPSIKWDVRPQEDLEQKGRTFQAFATALSNLRNAGVALNDVPAFAKRFGLVGLDVHEVDPVQVEARLAQATGKIESDDKSKSPDDAKKKGGGDDDEDVEKQLQADRPKNAVPPGSASKPDKKKKAKDADDGKQARDRSRGRRAAALHPTGRTLRHRPKHR